MASSFLLLVRGRGGFLAVGEVQAASESLLYLCLSPCVCVPLSVCLLYERAALLL